VIVRHCDIRGVLPKTYRSIFKNVARPDSVLAVALAKLLLDIGAVNNGDRVSGEGEVLHCIQLKLGEIASANRSVGEKLVVTGAEIEGFGDGQRCSALNDDVIDSHVVSCKRGDVGEGGSSKCTYYRISQSQLAGCDIHACDLAHLGR